MVIFCFYEIFCGRQRWSLDNMLDYLEDLSYSDNDYGYDYGTVADDIYTPFSSEVELDEYTDFRRFVLKNKEKL